ncbi:uncharacterized protein LOC131661492 [Vicia villosa]|uniref:uncharacterized protein LOC131661492 n=1 Tax=Vicia villosa TaxID=3911 RepID=UPI00273BF3E4|nr:uncharacterized protein LOC131661492 [Vicia villosa]
MKLVTKTIANRVKWVLQEVIDVEQSAFVHGRLIIDNALISLECFHWMKKKTKGKKGVMVLKLDMSKAYDRVEWDFLLGVIEAIGFPISMVQVVSKCVKTVKYQVLINCQPSSIVSPERGLWQGDHLSPYLFVSCANVYQESSGQMVNLDNLEALFNRNVVDSDKDTILNGMGVKTVEAHSRYFGLSTLFGRSKKAIFSQVIDKVWKKVKGWKEKVLYRAGKEVLIKFVVQAIPTYVMGCFKLCEDYCKEIESLLSRFWWGSSIEEKIIHWVSWSKMAKAKGLGGMGFRGISDFNVSLLWKHYWRLLTGSSSLLEHVFKIRYYPRTYLLDAKLGYTPSYAWRSILGVMELVNSGARWRIRNGQRVNRLKDN